MGERKICECLTCGRLHPKLGDPPWGLSHHDACFLSRAFNSVIVLNSAQTIRINEWLKKLIANRYEAEQ